MFFILFLNVRISKGFLLSDKLSTFYIFLTRLYIYIHLEMNVHSRLYETLFVSLKNYQGKGGKWSRRLKMHLYFYFYDSM